MQKRLTPAATLAPLLAIAMAGILLTGASATAQFVESDVNVLYSWVGENANDRFGHVVRPLGDVDGDGTTDIGITTPFLSSGGANAGKVYVISGATGDTIRTHLGVADTYFGNDLAGIGDINGDSLSEYAVSAPGTSTYLSFTAIGEVFLFDGATGGLLHTWTGAALGDGFGSIVAGGGIDTENGIGDIDGDGTNDIMIGANLAVASGTPRGAVTVYSGASLDSVLFYRTGGGFASLFGFGLGSLGDMNGDGFAEIIVGAPNAGPGSIGRVYFFSGLTNTIYLPTLTNNTTGSFMGFLFTKGVGDLNGDGTTDLLAADLTDTANGAGAGRIYLMSGVDRSIMYDIKGAPGDAFGVARGIGDIDGDGCDDVVATALSNDDAAPNAGKVSIISGKTGLTLRTVTCNLDGDAFGFSAVGVGDVSGDGIPDFMISANRYDTGDVDAGRVYLISGATATGVDHGALDGYGDSRAGFALHSIRPNPAAGPATIRFSLPIATDIDLSVYDVRGRLVQKLRTGVTAPGEHAVAWNGRTHAGASASSGIYFFKLRSPQFEATRKLILNR